MAPTEEALREESNDLLEQVITIRYKDDSGADTVIKDVKPLIAYSYPMLMPGEQQGFDAIKAFLRENHTMIWMDFDTWDGFCEHEIMRNGGSMFLEFFMKAYEETPIENYFWKRPNLYPLNLKKENQEGADA